MFTVVMHVFALGMIRERGIEVLALVAGHRRSDIGFALVMGIAVLLVTVLHALEAAAWGAVYLGLDALPDTKTAMLYSLSAMTTYGHASLYLAPHWEMMGAIESLNGIVLFSFSAATLFSLIDSSRRTPCRRNNG